MSGEHLSYTYHDDKTETSVLIALLHAHSHIHVADTCSRLGDNRRYVNTVRGRVATGPAAAATSVPIT